MEFFTLISHELQGRALGLWLNTSHSPQNVEQQKEKSYEQEKEKKLKVEATIEMQERDLMEVDTPETSSPELSRQDLNTNNTDNTNNTNNTDNIDNTDNTNNSSTINIPRYVFNAGGLFPSPLHPSRYVF